MGFRCSAPFRHLVVAVVVSVPAASLLVAGILVVVGLPQLVAVAP